MKPQECSVEESRVLDFLSKEGVLSVDLKSFLKIVWSFYLIINSSINGEALSWNLSCDHVDIIFWKKDLNLFG